MLFLKLFTFQENFEFRYIVFQQFGVSKMYFPPNYFPKN